MRKKCLLCDQDIKIDLDFSKILLPSKEVENNCCNNCLEKFEKIGENFCPQCHRRQLDKEICSDCKQWQKIYHENVLVNHSYYIYNSFAHDLMVSYKRRGDYVLRKVLQDLIRDEIVGFQADFFIPIPTSPEHQKMRKFNTISAIFSELVPLTNALAKKQGTKAQGEKNRQERLKTEQNFILLNKENLKLHGKVLILDDIYTTGRTLYHARDKLLEGFPDCQIESFSINR